MPRHSKVVCMRAWPDLIRGLRMWLSRIAEKVLLILRDARLSMSGMIRRCAAPTRDAVGRAKALVAEKAFLSLTTTVRLNNASISGDLYLTPGRLFLYPHMDRASAVLFFLNVPGLECHILSARTLSMRASTGDTLSFETPTYAALLKWRMSIGNSFNLVSPNTLLMQLDSIVADATENVVSSDPSRGMHLPPPLQVRASGSSAIDSESVSRARMPSREQLLSAAESQDVSFERRSRQLRRRRRRVRTWGGGGLVGAASGLHSAMMTPAILLGARGNLPSRHRSSTRCSTGGVRSRQHAPSCDSHGSPGMGISQWENNVNFGHGSGESFEGALNGGGKLKDEHDPAVVADDLAGDDEVSMILSCGTRHVFGALVTKERTTGVRSSVLDGSVRENEEENPITAALERSWLVQRQSLFSKEALEGWASVSFRPWNVLAQVPIAGIGGPRWATCRLVLDSNTLTFVSTRNVTQCKVVGNANIDKSTRDAAQDLREEIPSVPDAFHDCEEQTSNEQFSTHRLLAVHRAKNFNCTAVCFEVVIPSGVFLISPHTAPSVPVVNAPEAPKSQGLKGVHQARRKRWRHIQEQERHRLNSAATLAHQKLQGRSKSALHLFGKPKEEVEALAAVEFALADNDDRRCDAWVQQTAGLLDVPRGLAAKTASFQRGWLWKLGKLLCNAAIFFAWNSNLVCERG
eukprot:INCI5393.1.p1 GENE.INCI5393.1~~INCI5393.1.p1  ORF type:complete len:690 (-),score=96.19 INCI5393.1:673-2742(-)